jgi:hypothetical protein
MYSPLQLPSYMAIKIRGDMNASQRSACQKYKNWQRNTVKSAISSIGLSGNFYYPENWQSFKLSMERLTLLCCANATAPCYVNSGEKGLENAAWKTGLDIKWQVKCLGPSMRLLDTLRYTLSIIFWYLENCNIRQTFGPGGAGYGRLYCGYQCYGLKLQKQRHT